MGNKVKSDAGMANNRELLFDFRQNRAGVMEANCFINI